MYALAIAYRKVLCVLLSTARLTPILQQALHLNGFHKSACRCYISVEYILSIVCGHMGRILIRIDLDQRAPVVSNLGSALGAGHLAINIRTVTMMTYSLPRGSCDLSN